MSDGKDKDDEDDGGRFPTEWESRSRPLGERSTKDIKHDEDSSDDD